MPRTNPHALVLGDINVDISLAVDRFPEEGGDARADARTLGSGGGGLNAAVALRGLGVDVSLVGCVGTDALSDLAIATARRRGVDLSRLQRHADAPTGTCVLITTPGGERTLVSHRGANVLLDGAAALPQDLQAVQLVLLFGYALMASPQRRTALALIERAREAGCVTAMDVGLAVARKAELVLSLLGSLDLLLLNESELMALTRARDADAALDDLLARGARCVVVKRGARGCIVAGEGERTRYAGPRVDAVDTTACGDAFAAAFSWTWASGASPEVCARLANRMGAWTACRRGAAESVPTEEAMNDEMFPLVDEEGHGIGSALRSAVHGNPSLLHPVVHCLVTDARGFMLLQLRSEDKDIQPGKWDTSVGGHVALGETVEQAVHRELLEEIGVDSRHTGLKFLYRYLMRNEVESELVHTFGCQCDGPFVRQASEIDALRLWSTDEIEAALGTGVFTPNFEDEYRRFRGTEPGEGHELAPTSP